MKSYKKLLLLSGVSATAIAMGGTASFAQENRDSIEEVVVIATKRSQNVQEVPLAMAAYTADFVKRANLDDVKDLIKFTPGFAGDSKDSFVDFVNVRGISTNDFGVGGDPSIGFFKNGLYQGRQGTAVSSLYDLERAEVLRGPQGFLFGRNAISGAISFYTAKPDFDNQTAYIDAGVGERGIMEVEGAVNYPLSENLAIRVAGYKSKEDGWIHNIALPNEADGGGHDKTSGRFTIAMQDDKWDGNISVEYEDRETSGTYYRAVLSDPNLATWAGTFGDGILPPADMRAVNNDAQLGNFDRGEILSIGAEFNFDLGFATLSSLTGYKDHTYDYAEDYDGTGLHLGDYAQDQEGTYFEQELRLVSQSEGPLSWYAGVSFYKEEIESQFTGLAGEDAMCGAYYYYYDNCNDLYAYWGYGGLTTSPDGLRESNISRGTYTGWGAYVEGTYAISDKFDIGVGLRYTKDTKEFGISILPVTSELGPWYYYGYTTDGFVETEQSWSDVTPRVIARYRPSSDMMLYASVTKGYKTGGFNSFGTILTGVDANYVALPGTIPNHFDPETVWSYEAGAKGSLADKRIRYDMSIYHYKYTDLQLNYWDAGTIVANVGKVEANGIEGSVQAIMSDSIDVILTGSYNDNEISGAEFISPGSDGNRLSGTPKFKTSGLITYHTPVGESGEVSATVEFVKQSSVFIGISNAAHSKQSGWEDVSLRLSYESSAGWSITGYVENVTNSIYFDGGYDGGDATPAVIFGAARPRTMGLKFSMSFE